VHFADLIVVAVGVLLGRATTRRVSVEEAEDAMGPELRGDGRQTFGFALEVTLGLFAYPRRLGSE
jgi:hypothetical protein